MPFDQRSAWVEAVWESQETSWRSAVQAHFCKRDRAKQAARGVQVGEGITWSATIPDPPQNDNSGEPTRGLFWPPASWLTHTMDALEGPSLVLTSGPGPTARSVWVTHSILVDDCRTSALRKQLVPLDAWPHRIEGIAAGAPAAAAEWHAARRQQKAALPLGTAAVAEHPTRSGGRQRKLAREARQGLDWLAVRDAQAWMQERFGSGWYATTQANLEVSRERASFRAAFQGGEAAVVQFKERAASCGISTGSGGC